LHLQSKFVSIENQDAQIALNRHSFHALCPAVKSIAVSNTFVPLTLSEPDPKFLSSSHR